MVAPASPAQAGKLVLRQGEPIHTELQGWAKARGWELLWGPTVSWRVLRETDFFTKHTDVVAAISEAIEILREEGKPLRLHISDGNKVMEVISNEVRND